jgi:hypothetical protein
MNRSQLRASEQALFARSASTSLDNSLRDETRGGGYGLSYGGGNYPRDDNGLRLRGAVGPDHAVSRRLNHGNAGGYTTQDFGPSDVNFRAGHLDAGIARRMYDRGQSWLSASKGAGLSSGKPEWPSDARARAGAGDEYDGGASLADILEGDRRL